MNGHGKSDRPVVPPKPPNKGDGAPSPAEGVEGRGLAKENLLRQNQSNGLRAAPDWPNELERIRQAAKKAHPYPAQRLRVRIQGKSPVRYLRSPGSVEGARGNPCPYSDHGTIPLYGELWLSNGCVLLAYNRQDEWQKESVCSRTARSVA